jgi:hypothetical protein
MKKLIIIIIVILLPLIISAQEMTNLRSTLAGNESRDSIIKKLLPFAEKWRKDYNSKAANQLTQFYAENSGYISSNVPGYHGNEDLIAIFQIKKNIGGAVDSLLIFSVNSSCDIATLFIRHLEKVNRENVKDVSMFTWIKNDGSWIIKTHSEALEN